MAHRLSRDEMLMGMASLVAQRGTCSRLQVGAVFARNGRVISMGYNGAPAGLPHCEHWEAGGPSGQPHYPTDAVPDWVWETMKSGSYHTLMGGMSFARQGEVTSMRVAFAEASPGCPYSEHAERNGIAFSARHGVALEGSELYVTHMPCRDCARSIVNAGIETVVYEESYRDLSGIHLLEAAGVTVVDYRA